MEVKTKRAAEATHTTHHKDSYLNQKQIVFQAFFSAKTMFQVEKETGISRANICRYVKQMEDAGIIQFLYRDKCQISGCKAGYYTTNKEDQEPHGLRHVSDVVTHILKGGSK